jgi:hypothetical protein
VHAGNVVKHAARSGQLESGGENWKVNIILAFLTFSI